MAIDVALLGEDQMTASGTLLKAEVPMTHLESPQVSPIRLQKGAKGGPWDTSAEVRASVEDGG